MSEIPADVIAAGNRFAGLFGDNRQGYAAFDIAVLATMEERERCAKIAETLPCAELVSTSADNHEMTFGVGAAAQRNAIVSAIRKGDAA